ncbi:hypothetical protein K1T71_007836 [Dendrolimus kikuchii]|uniref:Uncharacterized protein n=1 Tax=Dendrolimus kikuchii TaxID=765133 RepID=A0ACC1CYI5_9NEOP|nr:hypothetical protein K1T71_007836 [Dendrolimus kikuchii]
MKLPYIFLFFTVILSVVILCDAYPFRTGNIDYMEALRRMQQIPQWHCKRYRKFHLHSHCRLPPHARRF